MDKDDYINWWRDRYNNLVDGLLRALAGESVSFSDASVFPHSDGAKMLLDRVSATSVEIRQKDQQIAELRRVVSERGVKLRSAKAENQQLRNDLIDEMARTRGSENPGVPHVGGKPFPASDRQPQSAVGGRRIESSIANLERRALLCIDDEQSKPNPDNALIAVLSDAVRLGREYADSSQAVEIPAADRPASHSVDMPTGLSIGDVVMFGDEQYEVGLVPVATNQEKK